LLEAKLKKIPNLTILVGLGHQLQVDLRVVPAGLKD
jgi:hypothetical protein